MPDYTTSGAKMNWWAIDMIDLFVHFTATTHCCKELQTVTGVQAHCLFLSDYVCKRIHKNKQVYKITLNYTK